MSTLTKVLIVLLTVSSIFLSGIVATYVANAENYRAKWAQRISELQSAKADAVKAIEDRNKMQDELDRVKKQLNGTISDLQAQIGELQAKLNQSEREKSELLVQVAGWTSIVKDFKESNDKWETWLQNMEAELKDLRAERDKLVSQNKELTTTLLAKMAIISQLEEQARQLTKQKTQFQTRLEQLLRQYGKTIAERPPAEPPTVEKAEVAQAPPLPAKDIKAIGLKGQITRVDLKNSLAEISIGAADGVKEKMKFYVTRDDKFICNILILDVDAERAVGFLELVQTPPRVGDKVSTNIGT